MYSRVASRAIWPKAVLAAIAASLLSLGTAVPALAYETPTLYSTHDYLNLGGSWGSAEYGRSSSKGWATMSGFHLAVKGKWHEFGQTGWTSYKWNHSVYGGYTSVNCYVCTGIKLKY